MRFDHLKSLYLSFVIFSVFFIGGLVLSQHKLLWLDELYTQHTAIDTGTYANILTSNIPDGNKNPLFYLIQKAVCNVFSFHMPAIYANELTRTRDIPSQVILRIPSDLYMSLAFALIFYFFTRFYSILAAFYALSVALVSPMVWMNWVEARPYSLWFLLTTVQLLLFCSSVIIPKTNRIRGLFWTHLLLCLTTPASMVQMTIVTLMLWLKTKAKLKQLALIWVLPMAVALFYYYFDKIAPIKTYMFATNLFDVVMPERLFIYVIYVLIAWVMPKKYKDLSNNIFFMPVFLLFLASGIFVLYMDLFSKNPEPGFFSRYLIYLTPPDILMFTLASYDLRQWSRQNPWVCMNVSIFLAGLVIMRGLMTYRDILASALYLHSPG